MNNETKVCTSVLREAMNPSSLLKVSVVYSALHRAKQYICSSLCGLIWLKKKTLICKNQHAKISWAVPQKNDFLSCPLRQ